MIKIVSGKEMSILSKSEIKRLRETDIQDEKLLIEPFGEDCLTLIGYDLRVGGCYKTYKNETTKLLIEEGQTIPIKPGETALIDTLERVCMPGNCSVAALLVSRVSQVNQGLSHISTKVDPNWDGTLKIAVSNFSKKSIELKYKEKICCIVFFDIKNPSKKERRIPDTDSMNTAVIRKNSWEQRIQQASPFLILLGIPSLVLLLEQFWQLDDNFLTVSVLISVALFNFKKEAFFK